eukprot:m.62344 g.62344  ORF g.62344 m.62344 type:complete len:57 (+) comp9611_c0_seq2:5372-5542(+)
MGISGGSSNVNSSPGSGSVVSARAASQSIRIEGILHGCPVRDNREDLIRGWVKFVP